MTNNSYTYDKSGNVTYDGANWYAYDNEGRLCAMQTNITGPMVATGYLYDAEGRRVAKGTIPVTATPITSSACVYPGKGFVTTETYVLGQGGEQLSTWAWTGTTSTWERTNVYGAGAHLATFDADPAGSTTAALHFMLTDHLGTRRMQTDPAGTPETDCQSLPYGDGQNCFTPSNAPTTADDSNPLHFTGKQRDTESGNDYFGARYYASTAGRFVSPDWSEDPTPIAYATLADPQSLNLYAYGGNDPLGGSDADGHYSEADGTDENGDHSWEHKEDELEAERDALDAERASSAAGKEDVTTIGIQCVDCHKNRNLKKEQEEADRIDAETMVWMQLMWLSVKYQIIPFSLPKPPTGPGSVPKDKRDPKRVWTKTENGKKLKQQNSKCAECGKDTDSGKGHHVDRHADGGKTDDSNHAVVCPDCHDNLHAPEP